MHNLTQEIQDRYSGPLDEERVWVASYGRSLDVPLSDVSDIVSEYADKIEATYSAVASIEEIQPTGFGIHDDSEVALIVIAARSADMTVFKNSMEVTDGEIRRALYQLDQQ